MVHLPACRDSFSPSLAVVDVALPSLLACKRGILLHLYTGPLIGSFCDLKRLCQDREDDQLDSDQIVIGMSVCSSSFVGVPP